MTATTLTLLASLRCTRAFASFAAIALILSAASIHAATAGLSGDLVWLKSKGTLLFEDSFDRDETGNGAKAIGNGWNSATADRVPHLKQADIDDGVLKVNSATKEAGHAIHLHHDAGFQDGGVYLRFRLPGIVKGYRLQVGFVDREVNATVHAGHLGYAFLSQDSILLKDSKTGFHSLDVQRRITEGKKNSGKMPEDVAALLRNRESQVSWQADEAWHDLLLVTEGDVMRLSIDGRLVHEFASPGFAHAMKRWVSLLSSNSFWVDDEKVWRVK